MTHDAHAANRPEVSFHEATVVGFCQQGSNIELHPEGVTSDSGKRSATVILESVVHFEIDGDVSGIPAMETADAEVLSLDISDRHMKLIVEWNEWAPHNQFVRSYDIQASAVQVKIMP